MIHTSPSFFGGNTFSVIIPTLQRAEQLPHLVAMLDGHPLVAEILIINNAVKPLPFGGDKLRVLQPPRNIYVNAAWNWGTIEARSDLLAFANDDITIEQPELLDAVRSHLSTKSVGMIGPHPSVFAGTSRRRVFRPVYERRYGLGTLMFMRRESFVPIPESLLIWCGDDWLFRHQEKRNYTFSGWRVHTTMGATSGAAEFSQIYERDSELFHREYASADDPYLARFRREAAVNRYLGHAAGRLKALTHHPVAGRG